MERTEIFSMAYVGWHDLAPPACLSPNSVTTSLPLSLCPKLQWFMAQMPLHMLLSLTKWSPIAPSLS